MSAVVDLVEFHNKLEERMRASENKISRLEGRLDEKEKKK